MRVKIKTLSPLHIGGKEGSLTPQDYVVFNNRCYVISQDRLAQKLYYQKRLDELVKQVKIKGKDFKIDPFLKERSLLNKVFLDEVSHYSSQCNIGLQKEIRPFIRDGFSQPFLPGSAIKGVLRTSIMYVLLKRLDPASRSRILEDFVQRRLAEYKKDPRGERGYGWFRDRFKQWFAQRLDENTFQRFTLQKNQTRYDPHSDILRSLKVSDSAPLTKDSLGIEEIKIFSARSHESPKRWSIFAECIPTATEFEFELKIDDGILQDFAKLNPSTSLGVSFAELAELLSHPFKAAEGMITDLWEKEKDFFAQEFHAGETLKFGSEQPNFRLGWGAGLLGTSMAMLLPEKLRQEVRNTLFRDCGNTPAPKSRRMVVRNQRGETTLGWCLISL